MVIADGLGDLPVASLGGQTPLDSAWTPTFDRLAAAGQYGLVDPTGPGARTDTHAGTAVLFGIPADKAVQMGRGPLEALGFGRNLGSEEIALRVNFATVNPVFGGYMVNDRRAGRITENLAELSEAISAIDLGDDVKAEFRSVHQHSGLLVLSGPGLNPGISDTDPGGEELPAPMLRCHALRPEARKTADKVNLFIKQANAILKDHRVNIARTAQGKSPANGILTRGAGSQLPRQSAITDMGFSAAVVTACNTVRGLGRLLGFDVVSDERFTGDTRTDITAKLRAGLEALRNHDIAFVHFKALDLCSQDRKPSAKREFIERLDLAMAPLLELNLITAMTADHCANSNTGIHTADPVPALLWSPVHGPGILGIKFGETACRSGTLDRQSGARFLRQVLDLMNRAKAGPGRADA